MTNTHKIKNKPPVSSKVIIAPIDVVQELQARKGAIMREYGYARSLRILAGIIPNEQLSRILALPKDS